MHKFVLISSVAAFSLVSGVAGAVTVKNFDKADASVHVTLDGKKETITLKEGTSYDSKGKDITFALGQDKKLNTGKGDEHFSIKDGKVDMDKPVAVAPVVAIEKKVDAGVDTVKPVEKTVTAPKAETK